jgi:hypothetical protein
MNVTSAPQSGLLGLNRGIDNVQKVAGDMTGSGKADKAELASGRTPDEAVETSASARHEAPTTQVVSEVKESSDLESVLGAIIDTHA